MPRVTSRLTAGRAKNAFNCVCWTWPRFEGAERRQQQTMITFVDSAIRAPGFVWRVFARHRNLLLGACMPLGFHPTAVERGESGAYTNRQEQIVTVVAASTAVLIVAAIAVLMGLA